MTRSPRTRLSQEARPRRLDRRPVPARSCRWPRLGAMMKAICRKPSPNSRAVTARSDAAHDVLFRWGSRLALSNALAFRGETNTARAAANASLAAAADLWSYNEGFSYAVLATAAVAAGDVAAAAEASEAAPATTECAGRARRSQYQPNGRSCPGAGGSDHGRTLGQPRGRGISGVASGPGTDDACSHRHSQR